MMAPRLSPPAITNALETPGSGFDTTGRKNDSHLPAMALASILPSPTTRSIVGHLPGVPMMIVLAPRPLAGALQ